jgi:hypothetical protein
MLKTRWMNVLAVLLVAMPAAAQFSLVVAPAAPTDVAPNALVQRADHNMPIAVNADLQWNGAVTGSLLQPLPSFFAICVYPAAAPLSCNWVNKTWSAAASGGNGLSFNYVYGAPPPPQTGSPLWPRAPLPIGIRYTFRPSTSLPVGLLNQPLKWQVGACMANSQAVGGMQCSFAAAKDFHFTSIDLVASNADMRLSTPTNLNVEVRATNPGALDGPAGPFSVRVRVWVAVTQVEANGARVCRTDWNIPSILSNAVNHVVIFGKSEPILLQDILAGARYDANDVVAVATRGIDGGPAVQFTGNYTDTPLPSRLNSGRFVFGVNVPTNTSMTSFVAAADLDWDRRSSSFGQVVEHNEGNNLAARCRSFL